MLIQILFLNNIIPKREYRLTDMRGVDRQPYLAYLFGGSYIRSFQAVLIGLNSQSTFMPEEAPLSR